MSFTLDDMRNAAGEAWGPFGRAIVDKWAEFNATYFAGVLRPIPIILTHTQPFGRRVAFCSYTTEGKYGRTITLNLPRQPGDHGAKYALQATNGTLLHEMAHQALFERGRDPAHSSEAWRLEIMRLHKAITGQEIWAGRSITKRDPQSKRVVRINEPRPDGTPSLTQGEIASWPHSGSGIELGKLGLVERT